MNIPTPREEFFLRGGILDKRRALDRRAAAANRAFFDAFLAHVRRTRATGVFASAGQLDIVEFPGHEVLPCAPPPETARPAPLHGVAAQRRSPGRHADPAPRRPPPRRAPPSIEGGGGGRRARARA